MRLLFWILLGGLIYFALRKKWRNKIAAAQREEAQENIAVVKPQSVESMLVCAHCGVYFPASEAVIVYKQNQQNQQEQIFCSREHQQQHTGE